jgi:integrase
MEATDGNLKRFRTWMVERGRVDGTADLYVGNVRSCAADPRGITNRLVSRKLAPNTMRCNLAALRAWAVFSKDTELRDRLADLKLPPARRVRIKEPLGIGDWRKVVRQIKTCPMRSEGLRQAVLLIAIRGFRSGDVLRMRRSDMVRAVDTGNLAYEGKGRKRTVIAAGPVMEQLKALVAIPRWETVRDLVSTSTIDRVVRQKIWRESRRVAKSVGVPEMNPHRFRHTFATNYLKELKGDPNAIVKLQKYMGWESMATAARYVDRVSQDELDAIGAGLVSGLLE